jgi:hypothetical protein
MRNLFLTAILILIAATTAAAQNQFVERETAAKNFLPAAVEAGLLKLDERSESGIVEELFTNSSDVITAALRSSYPAAQPNAPIRVFPYMRENLKLQGKDYDRVKTISADLLKFMNLESRIKLIYFTSEIPITAFINPNVIAVSTRAAELMNDAELQAVMAHEVCHLIIFESFKRAADSKNFKQLRALELFCDAGAAHIITAKGGNANDLIKGLEKMLGDLIATGNGTDDGIEHPTMRQRKKLIKTILK